MKQKITGILIVILVIATFGCEELLNSLGDLPQSITERIDSFETDINAESRTAEAILENFAPADEVVNRVNAEDIEFWNSRFDPDSTFTFNVTDYSNPDEVAVTVTESYNGTDYPEEEWVFVMYLDSNNNYLIKQIWDDFADTADGWLIREISQ